MRFEQPMICTFLVNAHFKIFAALRQAKSGPPPNLSSAGSVWLPLESVYKRPNVRLGSLTAATAPILGVRFTPRKPPRLSPIGVSATGQRQTSRWDRAPLQSSSLSQWGVEDAVDLHDIIVKKTLNLDHRARWIWRLGPEFCLRPVHHGREPV